MMITFSAFRTAINTLVFPDGQAEVRVPLFRNFIVNALIQLQTYVESYQLVNVNFYDKDQSWDDCGLSIIQACRGRIGAVYAFKPSCRCQRHFYDSASLEKLSCLYEHCRCHQTGSCCCGQSMFSSPSLYTANPYYCGDYVGGNAGCQPPYLAAQPEDDCGFKLSDKFFAIGPNQKLWLFPRFPCGYVVGVHWKGIRRSYLDNDYVPDDDDLKDAVAIYVESEVARRVDKDQATADKLYAEYRLKAGDIIFREEQDLKPRATRVCVEGLDLSELVQIYPDNPYPAYVGEQCQIVSSSSSGGVSPLLPPPNDFLIEYWKMEEASGPRTGSVLGKLLVEDGVTITSATGIKGNAALLPNYYAFNLTSPVPLAGNGLHWPQLPGSNGLTFAFWVKFVHFGTDPNAFSMLLDYDQSPFTSIIGTLQARFLTATNVLRLTTFNYTGSAQTTINQSFTPQLNQWYFIRISYDKALSKLIVQVNSTVNTYTVNGIADGSVIGGGALIFHNNFIGLPTGTPDTNSFLLDELGFWDAVLTESEAAYLYNGGAGKTLPFT